MMKSIDDKRLGEITRQIEDLGRRHEEQAGTVQSIRQKLHQTREDDLNREAIAVSKGSDKLRPKSPGVERALENAEHDLEVLKRALEMANGELSRFYAENHQTLDAKLQDAKAAKAREISELAGPLLRALHSFYQVTEDAKVLRPYRQQPAESSERGRDMVAILGAPQTTTNAFGADKVGGLERGQLDAVVQALINLGPQYEMTSEREGAA